MHLHNAPGDGKPDARAARTPVAGTVHPVKTFKDQGQLIRCYAYAIIHDMYHSRTGDILGFNGYMPAWADISSIICRQSDPS